MRCLITTAALCLLLAGCDTYTESNSKLARDNTAVNERDANGDTLTPMDQSNSSVDIEQVAAIRAAVLKIDDLSINGQNVKIITNQGKVVLRGPVANKTERDAIGKVAEKLAGAGNVNNLLEPPTN